MKRALLLAVALAGCGGEPRDEAGLLEACRSGRRSGEACEQAQRAQSVRAASARRALYRQAMATAP